MFDPPAFDVSSNKAVSREAGIINFRLQLEMQRKWHHNQAKNRDLSVGASLLASSSFDWGDITETLIYPNGHQKEFLTRINDYTNDGKP